MIKKFSFIMMLIAAFAFVGTAFAQEPPAHGTYQDGWGMNPTNWHSYTGSYNSELALYDPHSGNPSGNKWVVSWDPSIEYINYAEITLELWIEMNMVQTYQYTHYQWHRLGNQAENIIFTIDGTLKSNNPLYVSLVWDGNEPLDKLYFRRDVLGTEDKGWINNNNARDIPIDWDFRWGRGLAMGNEIVQGWTDATDDQEITFLINEACDHWYQFRGSFNLDYHEADGYYSLTMAGCPSPSL